ncbi:hypothetical protein ACHAWF_001256, partial [Thalassiosira exigua]
WWRLQRLLTPPSPPPLDSSAWLRGPPSEHQLRHCLLPPPPPARSIFPSFSVAASRRTRDSPSRLRSSAPPPIAGSTPLIPSPPLLPPSPAPPPRRAKTLHPPPWPELPSLSPPVQQRVVDATPPTGSCAPSPLARSMPPLVTGATSPYPLTRRAPPPSGSELTPRVLPIGYHRPFPSPPRPPKPKMAPTLSRIDDKSPAKGRGSRKGAKGTAPRRNPGRPARKKGTYAPSEDASAGTAAMESSPTTPTRDKRDNSGIDATPPLSGRRSRRGTRGGKRGKGKKQDVTHEEGTDADTAAREGEGPTEAPTHAGRAADRAAAARAKKKKKDGAEDDDSFDIDAFTAPSIDVSNSLFSHLSIAKGDADVMPVPADGFNVPPSVTVEGGPITMSPPTSPTRDAWATRPTDGPRIDVSEVRQVDEGRGRSKGDGVESVRSSSQGPADEGVAGEREINPKSASTEAHPTKANTVEHPAEMETGTSRQPVESAMETEETNVEDGATTEGVSTGGAATPPGRSHRDVNLHPTMVQSPAPLPTAMGAPRATVAPPPAPDPSPTTGAAASDATPVQTPALPGGVSTYGGLKITSAQLADVFHGRKIDDV